MSERELRPRERQIAKEIDPGKYIATRERVSFVCVSICMYFVCIGSACDFWRPRKMSYSIMIEKKKKSWVWELATCNNRPHIFASGFLSPSLFEHDLPQPREGRPRSVTTPHFQTGGWGVVGVGWGEGRSGRNGGGGKTVL